MADIASLGPSPIASLSHFAGVAISGLSHIGPLTIPTGGGTSPGLTNIVAWYDMADNTDADGGTYNLAEQNSPSYTAGPPSYGTSTDGTGSGAYWQQTSLDNNFGNVAGDWSFVIRWRANSGVNNNDDVFTMNGGRSRVRYNTTAITARCSTASAISSTVAATTGTWYTCVASYNNTSGVLSFSVNNETFVTSSLASSTAVGTGFFGATNTTLQHPFDIDFMGFWNKTLSQDNVTWLYNGGNTRTYAEL